MWKYKIISFGHDRKTKVRIREFYSEDSALEHAIHAGNMGWLITVERTWVERPEGQLLDWTTENPVLAALT